MKNILLVLTLCSIGLRLVGQGQSINQVGVEFGEMNVEVVQTQESIKLDGVLDEPIWDKAERMTNFSQYFPSDSLSAIGGSEVYITYDDQFLYVAAKCYSNSNDFIVSSLKRDYGFGSTDNISLLFDTYSDKTNCYLFGMNPYGARREALISNGGKTRDSFDPSWDNKWYGESKIYEDHWICELAIPFKILRFDAGSKTWRFNAYRNDAQANEITSFINIPREYILMDMEYMASLSWQEPLEKPGRNISLIPYLSASINRNYEDLSQEKGVRNLGFGGDAKISLSSNLNLDLTVNPDFSQVEVDRQVTDLSRFEIFFPERRQFFLENADLFGRFGGRGLNPFFSRRIGISRDTTTNNIVQNTIYAGGRLSGKINEKLRIGLLSMQTASQLENDLPSFNYTVAAAEQNVFDRSSIAAIFVNKQALSPSDFGDTHDAFDRVAGLEYRLKSKDNFWTGKASYLKAFTPSEGSDKYAHVGSLEYNKERYRLQWQHQIIGNGFDAETGFVPRRDILSLNPAVDLRFFPSDSKITQHTLSFNSRLIYKMGKDDNTIIEDFGREELGMDLFWNLRFTNNSNLSFGTSVGRLTLLNDFDPTRIQADSVFLEAGSVQTNALLNLRYNSDRRKKISYRLQPSYGNFFGGKRFALNGAVSYRYTPYGSISLDVNYNNIRLGQDFQTANLWLIGPRVDITFTRKHFLTTFVQYNNQSENVSINTRYQWRFAPASDFFLVYSDNFNTGLSDGLVSRNRGVVAKLTYWLNL